MAEFVKSEPFGQVFVSRTKPGITRGNHFHHTKTEKFLVLEGEAVIRFRWIGGHEVPKRSEVERIRRSCSPEAEWRGQRVGRRRVGAHEVREGSGLGKVGFQELEVGMGQDQG